MKAALGKLVRKHLHKRVRESLPQFTLNRSAKMPPGCSLYEYRLQSCITLYMVLLCAPQADRFNIEIGWSTNDVLPASGCFLPTTAVKGDGIVFRLWRLWRQDSVDHWWHLGRELTLEELARFAPEDPNETKIAQVEIQVEDAFQRLLDYGVPYWEKVAADHGCPVYLRK